MTGRSFTVILATIPSWGAIAGGYLDERAHFGFTNWRGACRASGLSARSLVHFTLELLPLAVAGLLVGGLVVLCLGFFLRYRHDVARTCTAAHLGCAFAMPLGLFLCATSLSIVAMLAIDVAIAALLATIALRRIRSAAYAHARRVGSGAYSVRRRRGRKSSGHQPSEHS